MKTLKNITYFVFGFVIAAFLISMTGVGAQVSEGISRVLITNTSRDPIPVTSREALKIKGEVEINGKPEVKLDGGTKIKIESIDKPVKVRFEKDEAMPETNIFKDGARYNILLAGETQNVCAVEKVTGTWIYCEQKNGEGEIVGWVNSAQISHAVKLN